MALGLLCRQPGPHVFLRLEMILGAHDRRLARRTDRARSTRVAPAARGRGNGLPRIAHLLHGRAVAAHEASMTHEHSNEAQHNGQRTLATAGRAVKPPPLYNPRCVLQIIRCAGAARDADRRDDFPREATDA